MEGRTSPWVRAVLGIKAGAKPRKMKNLCKKRPQNCRMDQKHPEKNKAYTYRQALYSKVSQVHMENFICLESQKTS